MGDERVDDALEINILDTITKGFKTYRPVQPIRRDFSAVGYAPASGASPFCVFVNNMQPAKGRMWELTDVGVFYTDGHSNQNGSNSSAGASVTPTVASQTVDSVVLQRGSYSITYNGGVSGTTTAADFNNMRLFGAGLNQILLYNGAAGTGASTPTAMTVNVSVSTATTIGIQTIGVPSGTAVYYGNITATLLSSIVVADVYIGAAAGLDAPGDLGSFVSSGAIPFDTLVGKDKAYGMAGDFIYAWVYNAPANQQVVLAGTLLDWRTEDRSEMYI